jgi:hypothetical protein
VTVQQDQTSASFTINTYVVPTTTNVSLTATMGTANASTTLNVLSPAFEGFLNGADCDNIFGWAWDSYRPNTPINVDILVDGAAIVFGLPANIYRGDLVASGKGNGVHGFEYPTPPSLRDGGAHTIAVYYSGSVPPTQLGLSPKSITCAPPVSRLEWMAPGNTPGYTTWDPNPTDLILAGTVTNVPTGTPVTLLYVSWSDNVWLSGTTTTINTSGAWFFGISNAILTSNYSALVAAGGIVPQSNSCWSSPDSNRVTTCW